MSDNSIKWNEVMDACNASPLEMLNYYMVYPAQLVRDADSYNLAPFNYFIQVYNSAIEYYNEKFT